MLVVSNNNRGIMVRNNTRPSTNWFLTVVHSFKVETEVAADAENEALDLGATLVLEAALGCKLDLELQ
jgi:hypothetical protein